MIIITAATPTITDKMLTILLIRVFSLPAGQFALDGSSSQADLPSQPASLPPLISKFAPLQSSLLESARTVLVFMAPANETRRLSPNTNENILVFIFANLSRRAQWPCSVQT